MGWGERNFKIGDLRRRELNFWIFGVEDSGEWGSMRLVVREGRIIKEEGIYML